MGRPCWIGYPDRTSWFRVLLEGETWSGGLRCTSNLDTVRDLELVRRREHGSRDDATMVAWNYTTWSPSDVGAPFYARWSSLGPYVNRMYCVSPICFCESRDLEGAGGRNGRSRSGGQFTRKFPVCHMYNVSDGEGRVQDWVSTDVSRFLSQKDCTALFMIFPLEYSSPKMFFEICPRTRAPHLNKVLYLRVRPWSDLAFPRKWGALERRWSVVLEPAWVLRVPRRARAALRVSSRADGLRNSKSRRPNGCRDRCCEGRDRWGDDPWPVRSDIFLCSVNRVRRCARAIGHDRRSKSK